jgi:hypothetical protein
MPTQPAKHHINPGEAKACAKIVGAASGVGVEVASTSVSDTGALFGVVEDPATPEADVPLAASVSGRPVITVGAGVSPAPELEGAAMLSSCGSGIPLQAAIVNVMIAKENSRNLGMFIFRL